MATMRNYDFLMDDEEDEDDEPMYATVSSSISLICSDGRLHLRLSRERAQPEGDISL